MISFKALKHRKGNTDEFYIMVKDYDVYCIHEEVLSMKIHPEKCRAGFYIKDSVMEQKMSATTTTSTPTDVYPNWPTLLHDWKNMENFSVLRDIVEKVDVIQRNSLSNRNKGIKRKAPFVSFEDF